MRRAKLRRAVLDLRCVHVAPICRADPTWDQDMRELYDYTNGAIDMAEAFRRAFCPQADREDLVTWIHAALRERHPAHADTRAFFRNPRARRPEVICPYEDTPKPCPGGCKIGEPCKASAHERAGYACAPGAVPLLLRPVLLARAKVEP